MKKFLVFGFIMGVATAVFAQPNCSQTLRLARSTYEQGRLHELEGLLTPCLNSGFTPAEKVEGYKFLTLAYIYLEEPEKADDAMLKILQTDHYFEINPAVDPAEFVALYNTFRHNEIYRLGIKLGGNAIQPNLKSSDNASASNSKYKLGYGFSASFVLEVPFTKKITLNPEIQLQLGGFSNTASSTQSTGEFSTLMNQSLSYIGIPLIATYELAPKKYHPYLLGGAAFDYLFGATRTLEESRPGYAPVEPNSTDNSSAMNKLNISAVVGAGIRLRVAGGYFITEIRYKYGFSSVTRADQTYLNDPQVFGYKYSDSIYGINCLSLSVGYVQNFFNPKKLKPKR